MTGMEFEWDEANRRHIAAHGITPEQVETAWSDPFRLESQAYEREGETRTDIIGMSGQQLIFVVYTIRGDRVRPVTARPASRSERRNHRSAHT